VSSKHSTTEERVVWVAGRYVLAAAIRCGHCGKSINGATIKEKLYYQCQANVRSVLAKADGLVQLLGKS
jgi:DNA-directed RNA polymerase subunit RPC12/RpoP